MKQQINEIKRMQQLAGLIVENQGSFNLDKLIDRYLAKVQLTLTPEERAKFKEAIEMDYEDSDITTADIYDLNDIFSASGIRAIEDDEEDDY